MTFEPGPPVRHVMADTGRQCKDKLAIHVHSQFRSMVSSAAFPCIVGKSVIAKNSYRFGLYHDASAESLEGLSRDLFSFVIEQQTMTHEFSSFVASFRSPKLRNEKDFEKFLWNILQELNVRDSEYFSWNHEASNDPTTSGFAFSFASRSFFVIGLHALSSRVSRTFPYATLVFNSHEQFVRLQDSERFDKIQQVIRHADVDLQGDINPSLTNVEAAQYSGRQVGKKWKCPFKALMNGEPLFSWDF